MPILKQVAAFNGSLPTFHVLNTLTVDYSLGLAKVHVLSYIDEATYLDSRALSWNWNDVLIPLSRIGDAEVALTDLADSPFFGGVIAVDPAGSLDSARQRKVAELNTACEAAIYAGFDCDALGATYHYPANEKDQRNLIALVLDSFLTDTPDTWTTSFWCADPDGVWEYRPHTIPQIRAVGVCGKVAIMASLGKNEALARQVSGATAEGLATITWDAPVPPEVVPNSTS